MRQGPRIGHRIVRLAGAVVTAVSALMIAPATTALVVGASPAPYCANGQVRASVHQTQGALGTIYYTMRITATGSGTCRLYGWPIMVIKRGTATLASHTSYVKGSTWGDAGANKPAAPVLVAKGRVVSVDFAYSDVTVGNATSCPTTTKVGVGWARKANLPTTNGTFSVTSPAGVAWFDAQINICGHGAFRASPFYAG